MTAVRRWAPMLVSSLIICVCVLLVARTPRDRIAPPPLPTAVHVRTEIVAELRAETAAPLFAPSRSNLPISVVADQPPPSLTGLILGPGKAVALIRTAKGDTVMGHAGDVVDGWTIVSIAPRHIQLERQGETQSVELIFSGAQSAETSASPPTAQVASPPGAQH